MASLLGIDSGLTVTKAVVFDAGGAPLAVARRRVPQAVPRPRHVERDMEGLWRATAEAIAEAVAGSGRPAEDIRAVAATAHGDGLYLLGADARPLGPAILSLDTRAAAVVDRWGGEGLLARAIALTGQAPQPCAPAALLAWLRDEDPARFARIAHVLACKDWLRFRLTGRIGTDRTEASTSFADVATQGWSPEALRLYGLEGILGALPPVGRSDEVAGVVTEEAARLTGLRPGTPVAFGLHDVTASGLGTGGQREGAVDVVAGTYSINEVVSSAPRTDPRWLCRAGLAAETWNSMAISPASAANYDWFVETLCAAEANLATAEGWSIHALLAAEVDAALARPSTAVFHPYLYGSPHPGPASGAFLGLHGWQDRGDLLRAVLEGIAFNHRVHVDALRDGFAFDAARLTGGASRNPAFARMMADVLGLPVTVTATEEAAAWGAALCAGAAAGLYASPWDDPRDLAAIATTYDPEPRRAAAYAERYALHNRLAEALMPHWPAIERLGEAP